MKIATLPWMGTLLLLSAVSLPAQAPAQTPDAKVASLDEIKNQAELDKAIIELDRQLFGAYNRCDLKKFDSMLADDVEFYHDQGGVTLGHEKLTESIKNNICTGDTQRVLVPGTLKIYYMKSYGAIEMGVHRFLHPKRKRQTALAKAALSSLALQGRRMEGNAGVELRPPFSRQSRDQK